MDFHRYPNRPLYALGLVLVACAALSWCMQARASWLPIQVWAFGDGSRCAEYACYVAYDPQGPWTRSSDTAYASRDGQVCQFENCGNRRWVRYVTISPLDANGNPTDPVLQGTINLWGELS